VQYGRFKVPVNTCSIPVDGLYTPELLSTGTAEIRDIVELVF
jgi:hypothetical protein